jgi:protein-L-isoaspartate(D-aspartate) O-methyltransferase
MNSSATDESSELARQKALLISALKNEGILKSENIERAFSDVRREDFAIDPVGAIGAYFDEPLPLGDSGQTISAPHMVIIMLEELRLNLGQKVLEVGSGTGYNACLLGHIVSGGGRFKHAELVTTVERNGKLCKLAQKNVERAGFQEVVKVIEGDGSLGYPPRSESAIYDRITVTAGAPFVPKTLVCQLKPGGIMLIPVGNAGFQTLYRITKPSIAGNKRDEFTKERIVDCMFVPLVGENAYKQ